LFAKELRDLVSGKALWVMVLILCPVVGYGFLQAVALYGEASRSASTSPALARGLSPLDGVLVPTFGAFYVATTLLFPFVAIRSIGAEKQNGSLMLMLQLPYQTLTVVLAKLSAVLVGWTLALIPAASALVLWSAFGGHLYAPETLILLLGYLLYGLLIATIGLFAASVTETPSTAAIVALTFTLGAWVLDFMAIGQGIWTRYLADLSPTAALKSFESGLFSLPSALGLLVAAATLTAITAIWVPPGRRPEVKVGLSAAAVAGALCLALLVSKARFYADVTEDRRNSFPAAQEAALQHLTLPLAVTVYLAPDDPRLVDFNRSILSKLRRLVPHLTVTIADISKTLLGPASDDRYGLVTYDYGGKHEESRSTSPEEVLPLLYGLAGVTVAAESAQTYPGYPLQADSSLAAVWFYGALPLLLATFWWRLRRRPAPPADLNRREVSHDYQTKTNSS
jgi:ABC-type transport system involved in multi-copper enzyme maturation permease subunit